MCKTAPRVFRFWGKETRVAKSESRFVVVFVGRAGADIVSHVQESRNVTELREKIKGFLASQGMIKGHSGSGPRTAEQEPQILRLNDDAFPAQPIIAPHLALSDPNRGDPNRVLLPPFNNLSAVRETWAVHPHPPLGYPTGMYPSTVIIFKHCCS